MKNSHRKSRIISPLTPSPPAQVAIQPTRDTKPDVKAVQSYFPSTTEVSLDLFTHTERGPWARESLAPNSTLTLTAWLHIMGTKGTELDWSPEVRRSITKMGIKMPAAAPPAAEPGPPRTELQELQLKAGQVTDESGLGKVQLCKFVGQGRVGIPDVLRRATKLPPSEKLITTTRLLV
ncbi:hypothetical protein J6590_039078 [Homalodisca vitripennis]|nr:hypothetical protein J6590_039078 [Homalodisca vitripennis]